MPVDIAASIAAYILEVVKDNNPNTGGHTQMALIRENGTVDHKPAEFSRRAGSALKIWDYYSNRLSAMIPLISVRGQPVIDLFLEAGVESAFLDDDKFEKLLFNLTESRTSVDVLVEIEEWAAQFGVVAKRGFLNVADANTADLMLDTKAIIQKAAEKVISGMFSIALKEPLNALIEKHNETLGAYLEWRKLASSHKVAFDERIKLNTLLADLNEHVTKIMQLMSVERLPEGEPPKLG